VYEKAIEITPNDTADLGINVKAIYVGSTGTMRVIMHSGQLVNFIGLLAGHIYPIHARRVHQTGTSAGGLIGLSD
jgi:hypothetical protein